MSDSKYVKTTSDDLCLGNQDLITLIKSVISKGGCFRLQAAGWSMNPFIKEGDVLTLSGVNAGECRIPIGTVIACRHGHTGLVIHRVIKRTDNGYLIRGDNNYQADGFVKEEEIIATVSGVERNGKQIKLGLGLEKLLIAKLSDRQLLQPILRRIARLLRRSIY